MTDDERKQIEEIRERHASDIAEYRTFDVPEDKGQEITKLWPISSIGLLLRALDESEANAAATERRIVAWLREIGKRQMESNIPSEYAHGLAKCYAADAIARGEHRGKSDGP